MTPQTSQVPQIDLGGDVAIPQLGLGVWQVSPEDCVTAVSHALDAGYRHIDTAAAYGNEREVGQAIRESGVDREEVFVTTKVFNHDHGHDRATRALHRSLERLGMDYVDLWLIHWPVPSRDLYVETWQALVDARAAGLARAIGVSNFQPDHLRRLIDETGVKPAINQVELHPYFQQEPLRRVHEELGIVTEDWSPLGQGDALRDGTIGRIAEAHGKTPAQVVIRWHLQLGSVVIPKSKTPERIEENLDVFDFELGPEDMDAIAGLERGERIGPDPDTFVAP